MNPLTLGPVDCGVRRPRPAPEGRAGIEPTASWWKPDVSAKFVRTALACTSPACGRDSIADANGRYWPGLANTGRLVRRELPPDLGHLRLGS